MKIGIRFIVVLCIYQQMYTGFSVPNEDIMSFFNQLRETDEKIGVIAFLKEEKQQYKGIIEIQKKLNLLYGTCSKLLHNKDDYEEYFSILGDFNNQITIVQEALSELRDQIESIKDHNLKERLSQWIQLSDRKKSLFVGIVAIIEHERLKQQQKQLEHEMTSLKQNVEEKENQQQLLVVQLSNLQEQLQQTNQQLNELQAELHQKEQTLQLGITEKVELQKEIITVQESFEANRAKLEDIIGQLQLTTNELQQNQLTINQLQENLGEKQAEIATLTVQIAEKQNIVDELKKEAVEKERSIARLKKTMLFTGAYAIVATIVAGYFFGKQKHGQWLKYLSQQRMYASRLKQVLRYIAPRLFLPFYQ